MSINKIKAMINLDDNHVLFIEPKKPKSTFPVNDELTAKMREAMSRAKEGTVYRGWHYCICKTRSNHSDWILESGQITNSLAVHYLEYHRSEVPESEVEKVRKL